MNKILYIIVFFLTTTATAQSISNDSVFILPDTTRPFTIENLYQLIMKYHPIVKQTNLLSEVAKQEIRLARGNFDPKLETAFLLKHYNHTEYYRLFNGAIKLPNRSPITPAVGIERNKGENLNPENYISNEYDYKQMYAGFSIPLGQGLFTDERRTALKQAELFSGLMEAEQIKLINKLLLEAAKDYWQWYFSYYNYRLAYNTANLAEDLFRRIKLNYEGGEIASIDTVQSKITFLERNVNKQEAFLELKNSTLKLSTYLWDSLTNPIELSLQYAPVAEDQLLVLTQTTLEALINSAKQNHPELQKLALKLQQLELDRRLASEFMKPKLDVSYYMLNQPFSPEGYHNSFSSNDNYKFGVDFAVPLFLRKERAKVVQGRLKISATTFDQQITSRQIINEINTAYNQLLNNGLVLQQQRDMVNNYDRLLNAELINLENGESDLFKINIQQEKFFNAQSKLIKIISEYEKQKAILYWSAAVSPLQDSL